MRDFLWASGFFMLLIWIGYVYWQLFNIRDDLRCVREVDFHDTYQALMRLERRTRAIARKVGCTSVEVDGRDPSTIKEDEDEYDDGLDDFNWDDE